jgi:C-terminal processing protease CtpA/Prc
MRAIQYLQINLPPFLLLKLEFMIKKLFSFGFIAVLGGASAFEKAQGAYFFQEVKKILVENYINPKQINLEKVLAKYDLKIKNLCKSADNCFYKNTLPFIKELLNEFSDPHLKLIEREGVYGDVGSPAKIGRFGFFLISDSKRVIISYVYPDSIAERLGFKIGDSLVSVDKEANLEKIESALRYNELNSIRTKISYFRFGVKREVEISPNDTQDYAPRIEKIQNEIYKINFPELAKRNHDRITQDLIEKAKTSNAKGLIFDLRDNSGGTSYTSMKIAASFAENIGRILVTFDGTRFFVRLKGKEIRWEQVDDSSNNGKFDDIPDLEKIILFDQPVVILVSGQTYSAGEHLADFLQRSGHAKVFGTPTAGAMETSVDVKTLPDSSTITYGNQRYQDLNGNWLPSQVVPDVEIKQDLDLLTQGRDNVLEAAVEYLKTLK